MHKKLRGGGKPRFTNPDGRGGSLVRRKGGGSAWIG